MHWEIFKKFKIIYTVSEKPLYRHVNRTHGLKLPPSIRGVRGSGKGVQKPDGLVILRNQTSFLQTRTESTCCGTPVFMAPKICLENIRFTGQEDLKNADIWSLRLVCHYWSQPCPSTFGWIWTFWYFILQQGSDSFHETTTTTESQQQIWVFQDNSVVANCRSIQVLHDIWPCCAFLVMSICDRIENEAN